ncbi:mitochondrial protein Pet127-domain-containing protein [Lipomyces oligophaga]|uniref:mitochondrial protein Pet127-domain-containing protein n=1 Tax=Lipomyces oligophaga TaxID=45792 RepID=UPI0034CF0EC0
MSGLLFLRSRGQRRSLYFLVQSRCFSRTQLSRGDFQTKQHYQSARDGRLDNSSSTHHKSRSRSQARNKTIRPKHSDVLNSTSTRKDYPLNFKLSERDSEWKLRNTAVSEKPTVTEPVSMLQSENSTILNELPKLQIIPPLDDIKPPKLAHGLDRVLFNPGVQVMQDMRTGVNNFPADLAKVMSVSEFDYSALPPYQRASRDSTLQELASRYEKKYYSSTSNMVSLLAHFHFLISRWREPMVNTFSMTTYKHNTKFGRASKKPASILMIYNPETDTYAIDTDKTLDEENILLWLGKSMEKQLVHESSLYENFRRGKTALLPKEVLDEDEAYHYTGYKSFLIRSQQDCFDPRLPGEGTFDLKTRAVSSVRYDLDHIHKVGYSNYLLRAIQGKHESFESEFLDLTRTTMLKYLLQVRLGRMDGIFVAYHNIARYFGFQYVSRDEMEAIIHGPNYQRIATKELKASLEILDDLFTRITEKYPKTSVHLFVNTPEPEPFMNVVVKPLSPERAREIQAFVKSGSWTLERVLEEAKIIEDQIEKLPSEAQNIGPSTHEPLNSEDEFNPSSPFDIADADVASRVISHSYEGLGSLVRGDDKVTVYSILVSNIINNVAISDFESPSPNIGEEWKIQFSISDNGTFPVDQSAEHLNILRELTGLRHNFSDIERRSIAKNSTNMKKLMDARDELELLGPDESEDIRSKLRQEILQLELLLGLNKASQMEEEYEIISERTA